MKADMRKPFRRIVTGHDAAGRAIIQSDAPPTRIQTIGERGMTFFEVWNTRETPVLITRRAEDPAERQLTLLPPKNGARIRVLDIPPETEDTHKIDAAAAREIFAAMGAGSVSTHADPDSPHPFMHRTETIDYGIVLEGEVVLIVDEGETVVRAGDIVVQRGTNHAWANRSGSPCRIAFILVDGTFADGL